MLWGTADGGAHGAFHGGQLIKQDEVKNTVLVLTTSLCFSSSSCLPTMKFTFFFFFLVNYSIFHCCYLLKITENPW